jgi:hypothetical protein
MTWLVWILAGFSGGIIVGVLIDRDTVNKYYNKIRKVKVKNSENVSDVVSIKQEIKESRKKLRSERRAQRRSKDSSIK